MDRLKLEELARIALRAASWYMIGAGHDAALVNQVLGDPALAGLIAAALTEVWFLFRKVWG